MRKIKCLISALLSLCLIFSTTGCRNGGEIKDHVISGFNDLLQNFSQYALTKERDLKGDKTKGDDTYTGSYTAQYNDFNGKEYLFGGTGLERKSGNELIVTYELTVDSGSAKLYWFDKDDEYIIAESDANDRYPITLSTGDNYLVFEGKGFTGSLQVTVK